MSYAALEVLVYGGGVAAAATALELASRGAFVTLCGPVPVRQWPALPEAGLNTGRDVEELARWTLACGGDDAGPEAVRAMTEAAPSIFDSLQRMGVPFTTQADGSPALRQLEASDAADAAFAEGRTRAAVLGALDKQLHRSSVFRLDSVEMLSLVKDDNGRCVGAMVQDLPSHEYLGIRADAVVLACGGPEKLFDGAGALCVEGGAAAALACGARFVDAHRLQLHPLSLATRGDRLRLLSSAARAESARLWIPDDEREARAPSEVPTDERDYFLEGKRDDRLAADDVCARAVARVCIELGRGVYDRSTRSNTANVYLDLSHLPQAHLRDRLASEIEPSALFTGVDPTTTPLPVSASASLCLGGVWVDDEHRTSIDGLYAVGDVQQRYHGSCRLGGNGLLAELYGARLCADALANVSPLQSETQERAKAFSSAEKKATKAFETLLQRDGDASVNELHDRLRELLLDQLGPAAAYSELDASEALDELAAIEEESADAGCNDAASHANGGVRALRDLHNMLTIGELMLRHAEDAAADV